MRDIIFLISGNPPLNIDTEAKRSWSGFASLRAPTDKIDKNGKTSAILSCRPERIWGKTPTKNIAEISVDTYDLIDEIEQLTIDFAEEDSILFLRLRWDKTGLLIPIN